MKKLLLMAFLVGASPVLNVAASADTMYNDLVRSIILSNKTAMQKLNSLEKVERELTYSKQDLQEKLLNQYNFREYPQMRAAELGLAYVFGIAGTGLIVEHQLGQLKGDLSPTASYAMSAICLGFSAYLYGNKYIQAKLCTKKIKEIDTVLAKLNTLKKQLQTEHYFGTN